MKLFNFNDNAPEVREFLDGYTESPFGHHKYSQKADQESEYFMQYVHQRKLHRIALRTPVGFRVTYGLAEDVWNNQLGVITGRQDISAEINTQLIKYLQDRKWFEAMEMLTAFVLEQGEGIILLYTDDIVRPERDMDKPVDENREILRYEAINRIHYRIIEWDKHGEPKTYSVNITGDVSAGTEGPSRRSVRVDASRVMRFTDKDLFQRGFGYPRLAVIYDSIVILSNIVKATGEAAFRWGTGHPLILTKDITDDTQLEKLKDSIGVPTRRSWHILPSEYIDRFDLVGQAGQMLNLKALADIVIDQIIIATKIPRPILLGEVAGVVQGSEINERSYFAVLDELHSNLENFVREMFKRDVNIRKLLEPVESWELDWGIREVLNKMDQAKYDQMQISNTLALTSIITVNEARARLGIQPLEDYRGEIVLGVGMPPTDETNTIAEKSQETKKQEKNPKDLNKDKTTQQNKIKMRENKALVKDAITNLRKKYSVNEICDIFQIGKDTFYKIQRKAEENEV